MGTEGDSVHGLDARRPRLLVIGGSGFIGRCVVRRAVQLSWDVTSMSLRSIHALPGARQVIADIADAGALGTVLGDAAFDYVVNCGGYVDHALFIRGGRAAIGTHFGGVLNLAAKVNRETLRGFVNIGSSDEYGSAAPPQREATRESPISPYAVAKVAAAHFLNMLWRTEHFPATTLRLFLTYGPGQDQRRFLPQIITGCLEDAEFPVSEGAQLRDFCYITDVVDAIFLALDAEAARGQVINIGSGRPISIRQMVETVQQLIGRGRPQFGKIPYRPSESMALYADVTLAERVLRWQPTVALLDGVEQTIQWIRSQQT